MYLKYLDAHRKIIEKFILTRISCPIQAKETVRYTAQTTAKAMQNGETAKVRYETAPKKGTLMNDCPELLNHLKKKVCMHLIPETAVKSLILNAAIQQNIHSPSKMIK